VVLKVGGSVLGSPPSPYLLRAYADVIMMLREKGHSVAVVVGGGPLSREYIKVGENLGLSSSERDELAILVSRLNAKLLARALNEDSKVPSSIKASKKKFEKRDVVVMGGLKPGMTTDSVAAFIAKDFKADLLIKATDQDGIYTSDPKLNPNAKKIDRMSFDELNELMRGRHKPGIHKVLDPVAVSKIKDLKIKVVVINGFNPKNVIYAVEGKEVGTIIQ